MSRILIILALFSLFSCVSQRNTTERRGFMIPKKSELFANKKHYKEPAKRKTNKVRSQKKKNKSLF
jgi:hypothetical protein